MVVTWPVNWAARVCRDCDSAEVWVPLAACTAIEFSCCTMPICWVMAPWAVCNRETPSLALEIAWVSPLICEVKPCAVI